MDEFDLIETYFTWPESQTDSVALSVGDDAAIVKPMAPTVVCTDTLVEGVHFPKDAPPLTIGSKALAVNLSDLAAMGATPKWFTLALTLPEIDEAWVFAFSQGLRAMAKAAGIALIGGDTTRGPLSITITAMGEVHPNGTMTRAGAQEGDVICVSGTLGEAAYGLALWMAQQKAGEEFEIHCMQRLHQPTPRVALGHALAGVTSSCIDVSDGLMADLQHVLDASGVGADIQLADIPHVDAEKGLQLALGGGDDYELLFTMPESYWQQHKDRLQAIVQVTQIGVITEHDSLRLFDENGQQVTVDETGFNHFKEGGCHHH